MAGNHQESLWNRYRPGHYGGTWHRQWQTLMNDNCNTAFWKRKRKNYILDLKKIMTGPSTNNGTMISYSEGTMVQHDTGPGTAQSKTMSEIGNLQLLGFMTVLACTTAVDLIKAQWLSIASLLLMIKVHWMKTHWLPITTQWSSIKELWWSMNLMT